MNTLASSSFRIPFACDEHQRLVAPEDAGKGRRFTCPACERVVDLHAGAKKKRHYHHRASACTAETVTHLSAKRLIVEAVVAWRAGGPAPVFERCCAARGCTTTTRHRMPKKVLRAEIESRLPSGHVADVALLGQNDVPIAAIEVLVTHAVDDVKALEIGIPWVEVSGEAVCRSHGRVLVPVRDRFLPWYCAEHVDRRGRAFREERDSRKKRAALLRALPYRVEDFPGYHVRSVAVCSRGHDTLVFGWDGDAAPPWPRPPHVVARANAEDIFYDRSQKTLRKVLSFRRRFVSACTTCGAALAPEVRP
jgi:hypothetical protein